MQVWATYRNQDMTEGRGPMVLDKVFMEESDAHAYINQQDGVMGRKPSDFGAVGGWQNTQMGDWQVKPLYIMEHLDDGVEYQRAQLLERAYSKLTKAEKAAIVDHVKANVT